MATDPTKSAKDNTEKEARDFDDRLERALRKEMKTYFDFFDKRHPNDETGPLGWKDKTGESIVNPDYVSAYVSLRAERRATSENAKLQRYVIMLTAISATAVILSALLAAYSIFH